MKTLIVDNYDSFTYNLFQQLASVSGTEPIVVRNDQIGLEEIRSLPIDIIVLSSGPGRPDRRGDFGICRDILSDPEFSRRYPLLGICLGHQGIGHHYGCRLTHTPEPMHGRLSRIRHAEKDIFQGIPQNFDVVHYHSLCLANDLPDHLEPLAWTKENLLMALRHRQLPLWGIQFQPESISTQQGDRLMANFLELSSAYLARAGFRQVVDVSLPASTSAPALCNTEISAGLHLYHQRLEQLFDTEAAFVQLYGEEQASFWLGNEQADTSRSRFIFMGAAGGPHSEVITYWLDERLLTVRRGAKTIQLQQSIFDYLQQVLKERSCLSPDLPFDFNGGFVGYFGYELKAECGGSAVHDSQLPDASFIFADRLIAFDLIDKVTYLVALGSDDETYEVEKWFDATEKALVHLAPAELIEPEASEGAPVRLCLGQPYRRLTADIETCLEHIRNGESYKVCLTTQIHTEPTERPLDLYRLLRRITPAPYAAYLRLGDTAILSSSPEQFLKVSRNGNVSANPIGRTATTHADPKRDRGMRKRLGNPEKGGSANLTVVDLLRNDLGRVCEVGSVHVSKPTDVESSAGVYRTAGMIGGKLRPETTAVDCVRAAFPAGSVTGAPKIRSMEIIDNLEQEARGVYSGAIGFLGLNGAAELNTALCTIVATPEGTSLGVGRSVIALSDPEEEFDSILLKACALIQSIVIAKRGVFGPEHYRLEGSHSEALNAQASVPLRDGVLEAPQEWNTAKEVIDAAMKELGSLR